MNEKQYNQAMIGMIHYCAYWRSYSLILDVTDGWVTELDSFSGTQTELRTRRHLTSLSPSDKIMTVAEYYARLITGEAK